MTRNGSNGSGRSRASRSQIQIWDDRGREAVIGTFSDGETSWELAVVLESISRDLVHGRLSFRRGDERHDTAPVLVEESADAVVRRAGELPACMLRQLLLSARARRSPQA